jgi:ABC-type amino acid transport system permease subunit
MGMPIEFELPVLKVSIFKGGMVLRPEFMVCLLGLIYLYCCFYF